MNKISSEKNDIQRSLWPSQIMIFVFILIIQIFSCRTTSTDRKVIIYTSVDRQYSEPILEDFEKKTGIRVLPVYDVEAAKTTGLVNRLIAEKNNPQADVFWNGEFAQTILLKEKGILSPYFSESRSEISTQYLDPEGYWSGLGGRARVFIVNTELLSPSEYPKSLFDLTGSTWPPEKVGIAYPIFGTTATQAAAVYACLGPDKGKQFFQQLYSDGIRVVGGNSVVRDMVVNGQLILGLTDTDDACMAIKKGASVEVILPDQGKSDMGTLIIPNTVGLITNAPNPVEAQLLIDYLLSIEVEKQLIQSGWSQIPLRRTDIHAECPVPDAIKGMNISLTEVYEQIELAKSQLKEIFVQ